MSNSTNSLYQPHPRIQLDTGDEIITKQHFKAECDITNILRQYSKTGVITHVQSARPTYEDLPDGIDYQMAQETLLQASRAFSGLPSSVRDHFANDPARLLGALSDPSEADYLRSVGILRASEPAQGVPDPVPVPPPS
jgi:phage internal scaffolding protein